MHVRLLTVGTMLKERHIEVLFSDCFLGLRIELRLYRRRTFLADEKRGFAHRGQGRFPGIASARKVVPCRRPALIHPAKKVTA